MQQIDGSTLEGGGQILRNAVSFSALLQLPITVENIRASRKQPGLKAQHAAGQWKANIVVYLLIVQQAWLW